MTRPQLHTRRTWHLLVVGVFMISSACSAAPEPRASSTTSNTEAGPAIPTVTMRILTLGDSYTFGEAVAPEAAWPAVLADRMRAAGLETELEVLAGTGWASPRLAGEMSRAEFSPPYDLVTVQIGVNDHVSAAGTDVYLQGLNAILDEAVALANGDRGRVLIISIPDWTVTPRGLEYRTRRRPGPIDDFEATLIAAADRRGIRYVDITDISRDAAADQALVSPDHLHPSAKQYERWVDEAILRAALEVVG